MDGQKPRGFGQFDKLMKGLVNVRTPTVEEVAASVAAAVFLMDPEQVKRVHDAIDAIANVASSEDEFAKARDRLEVALLQRMKRN